MLVTLGWMLLAGLPHSPHDHQSAARRSPACGRRVTVWSRPGRALPAAKVPGSTSASMNPPTSRSSGSTPTDGSGCCFLASPGPTHYVAEPGRARGHRGRGGRSFQVDDDPGVGYLFAVAAAEPFDFRDITRGDYWDYRLIDDGRIQGDPYVRLTDLAARIAPGGDYDYDIAPYYVEPSL